MALLIPRRHTSSSPSPPLPVDNACHYLLNLITFIAPRYSPINIYGTGYHEKEEEQTEISFEAGEGIYNLAEFRSVPRKKDTDGERSETAAAPLVALCRMESPINIFQSAFDRAVHPGSDSGTGERGEGEGEEGRRSRQGDGGGRRGALAEGSMRGRIW